MHACDAGAWWLIDRSIAAAVWCGWMHHNSWKNACRPRALQPTNNRHTTEEAERVYDVGNTSRSFRSLLRSYHQIDPSTYTNTQLHPANMRRRRHCDRDPLLVMLLLLLLLLPAASFIRSPQPPPRPQQQQQQQEEVSPCLPTTHSCAGRADWRPHARRMPSYAQNFDAFLQRLKKIELRTGSSGARRLYNITIISRGEGGGVLGPNQHFIQ